MGSLHEYRAKRFVITDNITKIQMTFLAEAAELTIPKL